MSDKSSNWGRSLRYAIAALTLAATPLSAAESEWFTSWSASPAWGQPEADQPTGGFSGDTIRTIVQSSLAGDKAQLRFSNLYGDKPLRIGRATLALAQSGSAIKPGSLVEARFNGGSTIVVPPGGSVLSDPIDFDVPGRTDLAVSLYLTAASGPATSHPAAFQTAYVAAGDQASAPNLNGATATGARYFLTGVDVRSTRGRGTIVAFGDSITDGVFITVDSDRRWPDRLAQRLARAGLPYAVANAGISGNGHVVEGSPDSGDNASERFDRDVLSLPNVTHLIVMLGINDIGQPGLLGIRETPAARIIDGLAQVVTRARSHGIKVYGGTLTPFEGTTYPGYYTPEGEEKRQTVNRWIRTKGAFDGVIDFDAALADPNRPTRLLPAYDFGDHLHPNDKGFTAMAAAIDLSIFR